MTGLSSGKQTRELIRLSTAGKTMLCAHDMKTGNDMSMSSPEGDTGASSRLKRDRSPLTQAIIDTIH